MVEKCKIKKLFDRLKLFEQFLPEDKFQEAEASASFYTKCFIIYGLIGNSLYDILPFFATKNCEIHRTQHMRDYGIPCKVIVRYVIPFKYDYSPYYELVIAEQVLVASLGNISVVFKIVKPYFNLQVQ